MAITFNTGTTSTVTNSATPSNTFTIPAGVLAGDVIYVFVWSFTSATGTLTAALTSTATTPVQAGTQQNASGAGSQAHGAVFQIIAGASDAGATLTYSNTGGTGGSYWFNVLLVAYTGASASNPDVNAGTSFFSASSTGTTTTPSATTLASGDWQIQFVGIAPFPAPPAALPQAGR